MNIIFASVLLNGIKITTAVLCGALVGMSRSQNYKPMAISSLVLIALGACLFMIISLTLSPMLISEPEKVAANVMLGMLFLGIILVLKDRGSPSSLITIATIWVTAAIALAIGAGLFLEGITVTSVSYFILRKVCSQWNL